MDKIIGIDPDVKASGVAIYYDGKLQVLELVPLYALMQRLDLRMYSHVALSAGWLNKVTNFHNRAVSAEIRERISERVGANHEIGKQLYKFCLEREIPCTLIRPRGKKVKAEPFNRFTGWSKASNQEVRDAAMCIYSLIDKINK